MILTRPPLVACVTVLAAAAVGAGCEPAADPLTGGTTTTAPRTTTAPAAPVLRGEAARVAQAVGGLATALRDGDVERVCRPGAVLTPAVIRDMQSDGMTCEASVEDLLTARGAPQLAVAAVSAEPGLATARVRVRGGATVPLTLLLDGRRWLVSFSSGSDPLSTLIA